MDQYKRDLFNLKLQQALDSEESYRYLTKGSWLEGGCCALAMALQPLFPGSNIIVTEDRLKRDKSVHFVVVLDTLEGPIYLDYDGLQTGDEYMTKMQKEWFIRNPIIQRPNWQRAIKAGLVPQGSQNRTMTQWLANHLKEVLRVPPKYADQLSDKSNGTVTKLSHVA